MNKIRHDNRRKFIRLKAYHLAKYKPLSAKEAYPLYTHAAIRDIGAGGICLRTKEAIPVSSVIEIQFKFPALDTPVSTVAKVVWVKQLKKYKMYEIGAQFIEISESTRRMIDEQVAFVHEKVVKQNAEKSLLDRLFAPKKKKA